MTQSLTLTLIRHAESQNNARPEHQRVSDPALTELGFRQAEKLGNRLHSESESGQSHDLILTSPFLRTMQTIYPSAKKLAHYPVIRSNLFEAGGCYEGHEPGKTTGMPGMTRSQIAEQFPRYTIPDDIDENGWYPNDDFEPWHVASQRAKKITVELIEEFAGHHERVACMIHGDLIRLLLSHFCPGDATLEDTSVANTSVTVLRIEPNSSNAPTVLMHDNTDHLNDSERSF